MNKPQLQERARELKISFEDSDTNKVLEAKIAEAEAAKGGTIADTINNDNLFASATDEKFVEPYTEDDLREPAEVEGVEEKAEALLEVSVDMPETVPVEARTPEVKEALEDGRPLKEKAASIITTANFLPQNDVQEVRVEKLEKTPEEKKAEQPEGSKVFRYVGTSGTYQTKHYVYSTKEPFVLVDSDDVEAAQDNPKLREATDDEVEEFYS